MEDTTVEESSRGPPEEPVKSTAIVKYSAVDSPVHFARLKFNTDLKLPPSNWLTSSGEYYGLHHVLTHSTGFSSFRLAHMFPDCIGEVDVVSDAENIKKLLKIPYSRGPVSMMVHRVENTLLIDEFDIHKHLLRQAETDWEWLKKFFFEHVFQSLSDKDKGLSFKNNSRYALQQKSLVSKFLHYSLAEPVSTKDGDRSIKNDFPVPILAQDPALPDPGFEEGLPDSTSNNHIFTRNVVWTFEDIQMLLGTDMPIFGGSTHPCISLRLRDVAKPINVLTGIDYWLDNLMSNVPEVVMCYHLDGIVQRYELIKTEDLPYLPDAKFSPNIIRDVAQNILSFLKSNATKAGHTYWLFKGRDDDVVKLYDLSSLCSETLVDKGLNPFTVPVAMLLYRVARNMKQSLNGTKPQPGTIRMLLKNCLSLLPKEKYPQIATSCHYMLSDLYIPVETDPASPQLKDEPVNEEEEEEDEASNPVAVMALCCASHQIHSDYKYTRPPPLVGSVEERCKNALYHVVEGLDCLKYFDSVNNESQNEKSKKDQEEPKMAKPFEAIPMPYEKLNPESNQVKDSSAKGKDRKARKKKKSELKNGKKVSEGEPGDKETNVEEVSVGPLLCKPHGETMPTWEQPDKMDNESWKKHLCTLLLKKAQLVYMTLAEQNYLANRFGLCLRYVWCMLRINGSEVTCLERAGDCCFRIIQYWGDVETHRTDLAQEVTPLVDNPLASATAEDRTGVIPLVIDSVEQMLVASLNCYEKAIASRPSEQLTRKLGNVHNELGSFYMNQATEMFKATTDCLTGIESLLNESEKHLGLSLKGFDSVSDSANLALLHSNTGRLMRLKAHCYSDLQTSRLTDPQRHFYNKAQSSYLSALNVIGSRKANPIVWDTVSWELSTTLFTIASLTQDFPIIGNKTTEEVEREVVELLRKALKYCDLETPGPRQPLYQFRAAKIHHRLASLYHRAYREQSGGENRKKNILRLCQLHYLKSSKLLLFLEHPSDFLRVQLERVSLVEFLAETSTTKNYKLKSYQNALEIVCECEPILNIMEKKNVVFSGKNENTEEEPIDDDEQAEKEEEDKLILLLEERLQFLLGSVIELCEPSQSQKVSSLASSYKDLYNSLQEKRGNHVVAHLGKVIDQMGQMKKL